MHQKCKYVNMKMFEQMKEAGTKSLRHVSVRVKYIDNAMPFSWTSGTWGHFGSKARSMHYASHSKGNTTSFLKIYSNEAMQY